MRFLFFFAAAYILMAAVACQPLREAKAELESSKRAYRKPPKPPKPPNRARSATPKVKRRVKILETAGGAVTDFFSRFRSGDGGSKVTTEATEAINRLLQESPFTAKPKAPPSGPYDPSFNPAESRPETPGLSTREPFKFNGQEAGYAGDTDRNSRTSKLYDTPPFSPLLGPEADKAGNRVNLATETKVEGQQDKPKHIWEDPKEETRLAIAASVSLLGSLLLIRLVQQNLDTTNNLNAAIASANSQNQAAAQQALAENGALEAAGSGRGTNRFQRRDQFLYATSHKQLSKRAGLLTKVGEAAGKVGTRIRGGWHKFTLAWLKSSLLRFVVLWGSAFTAVSAATAGTVIYEHKKDKKHKHDPQAESPAAAPHHDDASHTHNKRSMIPTSNEGTSHAQIKLEKRFNPFRAVSECFQRTSVVEGARAVRVIVQHYPVEAKRLMIKYIVGASAFLGVAGALLYYEIRALRHPTPEPEPHTNQTMPVTPPVPAAASPPAGQLVHTRLYKRSIHVEQILPSEANPSEYKPAKLQTRLSKRRAPLIAVDELAKGAQEVSEKIPVLHPTSTAEKASPVIPKEIPPKETDPDEPVPRSLDEVMQDKSSAIPFEYLVAGAIAATYVTGLGLYAGFDYLIQAPWTREYKERAEREARAREVFQQLRSGRDSHDDTTLHKREQLDTKLSKRAPTMADLRTATEDALEAFRNRNRRLQRVPDLPRVHHRPPRPVQHLGRNPQGRNAPLTRKQEIALIVAAATIYIGAATAAILFARYHHQRLQQNSKQQDRERTSQQQNPGLSKRALSNADLLPAENAIEALQMMLRRYPRDPGLGRAQRRPPLLVRNLGQDPGHNTELRKAEIALYASMAVVVVAATTAAFLAARHSHATRPGQHWKQQEGERSKHRRDLELSKRGLSLQSLGELKTASEDAIEALKISFERWKRLRQIRRARRRPLLPVHTLGQNPQNTVPRPMLTWKKEVAIYVALFAISGPLGYYYAEKMYEIEEARRRRKEAQEKDRQRHNAGLSKRGLSFKSLGELQVASEDAIEALRIRFRRWQRRRYMNLRRGRPRPLIPVYTLGQHPRPGPLLTRKQELALFSTLITATSALTFFVAKTSENDQNQRRKNETQERNRKLLHKRDTVSRSQRLAERALPEVTSAEAAVERIGSAIRPQSGIQEGSLHVSQPVPQSGRLSRVKNFVGPAWTKVFMNKYRVGATVVGATVIYGIVKLFQLAGKSDEKAAEEGTNLHRRGLYPQPIEVQRSHAMQLSKRAIASPFIEAELEKASDNLAIWKNEAQERDRELLHKRDIISRSQRLAERALPEFAPAEATIERISSELRPPSGIQHGSLQIPQPVPQHGLQSGLQPVPQHSLQSGLEPGPQTPPETRYNKYLRRTGKTAAVAAMIGVAIGFPLLLKYVSDGDKKMEEEEEERHRQGLYPRSIQEQRSQARQLSKRAIASPLTEAELEKAFDGTTNYPVGSSRPRDGYEGSPTADGVGGPPNGRAGLSKRYDSFLATMQHQANQHLSRRALISEKPLQQHRRAFSKLAAAKEFTAAFRLAASDLKSLATNAPLTPLERQARNKRLRKYAYATGTGAVIKALVVGIIVARHKDKKDQQRRLEQWRRQQEQSQRGYYSNSHSYQKRDLPLTKRGELVHIVEEAEPLLKGDTAQVTGPTGNGYGAFKLGQHMRKARDKKTAAQRETTSGQPRKFRKRTGLGSLMRQEDRPHLDKRTDIVSAAMAKIIRQQRKRSGMLVKRGVPELAAAKEAARVIEALDKPVSEETMHADILRQQRLRDDRRAQRRERAQSIAKWTVLGAVTLPELVVLGFLIDKIHSIDRDIEYDRTHPHTGTTSGTEFKTSRPLQRRDDVLAKRAHPPVVPMNPEEVAHALEVLGNPAAEDGLRDTLHAQQEQRNRRLAEKAGWYILYGTGIAAGLAGVGFVIWQVAKAGRSVANSDKPDGQHAGTEHFSSVKGTRPLQRSDHILVKREAPRILPVSEEQLAQAVEVVGNPVLEEEMRIRNQQREEWRRERNIRRAKSAAKNVAIVAASVGGIALIDWGLIHTRSGGEARKSQQLHRRDDINPIGEVGSTKQREKRDHVLVKRSVVRPVTEAQEMEAVTRTGNPQLEERLAFAKIYAKVAGIVTAVYGGAAAIGTGIYKLVHRANERNEKARNGHQKRADIVPVAQVDMIAAQEVTGNPLHDQLRLKVALFCDKLSKGLAVTAAVLATGTGVAYLIHEAHKYLGPGRHKSDQHMSKRDPLPTKRDVQAVAPVAEIEMATSVEATMDPRYEEWKQNAAKLCKKVGLSVAAVVATLGAGVGIGYFSYLHDKHEGVKSTETDTLPTVPIHDFIHTSSQQPRRLVKRSLPSQLLENGESEEVISKRDSSTTTAQPSHQLVKRGEDAATGPLVLRVFRQVAIGTRRSGINFFDLGSSDEVVPRPQPQPQPHHRHRPHHPTSSSTLSLPPILLNPPPPGVIATMMPTHSRWRDSQRDMDDAMYDRGQLHKRTVEAAEPEMQEKRESHAATFPLPLLAMISLGTLLAFKVKNGLTVSEYDERASGGRRSFAHPLLYPIPRDRQRQTDWNGFPL